MKKVLFLICALTFILPAFSAENSGALNYQNWSQGHTGFNKNLQQTSKFKELAKPTKIKAEESSYNNDYLDEFDDDGFRKRKPVSTEKKVIKHINDNNGKAVVQQNKDARPMTYDSFPKSFEDANNNMIMMPTSIPGLF